MRSPIGIRIRRKRISQGLSQAALAQALGISPSYLNLIENNKRAIGGRLLIRLAERLNMDLALLSGESEARAIATLQEMFADSLLAGTELTSEEIRDLVAKFPEAALALTRLYRAHMDAGAEIDSLHHRLRNDPLLAGLLHQMLNLIAGVKSGAEILANIPDLTEAERQRFHRTLNHESQELATAGRNLVAHFDRSQSRKRQLSPLAELDEAIIASGNHFPVLEEAAESLLQEIAGPSGLLDEAALSAALYRRFGISFQLRSDQASPQPHAFDEASHTLWFSSLTAPPTRLFQAARLYAAKAVPHAIQEAVATLDLSTGEGSKLAERAMSSYVAGAMMMPYSRFLEEAERLHYDVDRLAALHHASFEQAAHRLVTLRRRGEEGVPFGFLRTDPAGRLTKRFPLPGLVLPIAGHGCMLWPLYQAFGQPGIVRQVSAFPGGGQFLMIARAETKSVPFFGAPPLVFSIMIACDLLHADRTIYARGLSLRQDPIPVGPSCLLCSRHQCAWRQNRQA